MKNFRKILIGLVVVCTVLLGASCKPEKTNITKDVPAISNSDATFFKVGDYTITNEKAFRQLLNSYGTETILNYVDDQLLPEIKDETLYQKYLDKIIYGSEEKTEEKLNEFLKELPLSGLSNNKNDSNYYDNYYRLAYRRFAFAKEAYEKSLDKDFFTDEKLKATFEQTYRKNITASIIRFDSVINAQEYLEAFNIDIVNVNGGFVDATTKAKLEQAKVKEVFDVATKAKEYKYTELVKISSKLATKLYNIKADEYTLTPFIDGKNVYLAYKVSETSNLNSDGEAVQFDDVKETIKNQIIEDAVTSTYSTKVALENAISNGLEVLDAGQEQFVKLTYENVYSTLSITDYKAYELSKNSSKTVVFTFNKGGKKVEVTADMMFDLMKQRYGEYLAALYLRQYIVLKDNGVYDLEKGTVLDQKKYDTYVETEITEYKDSFNGGDFAKIGYPASYGWENFIRDYLGITNEVELITNLDSSLYKDAMKTYKEKMYLVEEEKDGDTVVVPADKKVQDKMTEIYEKYLNVTAIGITVYKDVDLDNVEDELTDDEKLAANALITDLYNNFKVSDKDIGTYLNDFVKAYAMASGRTIYTPYKVDGFRVKLIASATYNASSNRSEKVIENLTTRYNELIAFEKTADGTNLSGHDLSKGYTYKLNDVLYTVKTTDFMDISRDIINDDKNNQVTLYFVTTFSKPVKLSSTEAGDNYKPTREDYLNYTKDASSITNIALKNCLTTYYIPAVNQLVTEETALDNVIKEAKELLSGVTYSNMDALRSYIDLCMDAE